MEDDEEFDEEPADFDEEDAGDNFKGDAFDNNMKAKKSHEYREDICI